MKVWIGHIVVPESVEVKIRSRRGLTGAQVRAACEWPAVPTRTAWRMMEAVRDPEDELAEIDLTEDEIDSMMAAGERVDVTAPPGAAPRSAFVVYVDELDLYGWRLLAASGQVLVTSRSYPTKAAAVAAAQAVIQASTDAALVDRTAS